MDEALIKKLTGLTNSEAENIKTRSARIKMLFIKTRATCKQLDQLETLINNGGNPVINFEGKNGEIQKQKLLLSQNKQVKRRERCYCKKNEN